MRIGSTSNASFSQHLLKNYIKKHHLITVGDEESILLLIIILSMALSMNPFYTNLAIVATVPAVLFGLFTYLNSKKYYVNQSGIILITGASTGIGRHSAEYLAKKYPSYIVLAGVRKDADADSIRAVGFSNLKPLIVDVTSSASCAVAVKNIRDLMDSSGLPFIALVNNAGISRTMISEFHAIDDARFMFETNFFGPLQLIQLTLPLLRLSKGRIINVSSLAGFLAVPLFGAYSGSKFAVEGLSDSLRREVAHFGISVSVIEPAYVKTEISKSNAAASSEIIKDAERTSLMKSLYGKFFDPAYQVKREKELSIASDPIVTSVAVEDAIVNPYPKTRYPVALAKGMHCSLVKWLVWSLSDRIGDMVLSK